jgi:prepilin-type N-terminal cleavage/methylation domain-containing protein
MQQIRPNAAFTLIELLVVVTIIVVLLAMLTPALDRALASAESVVCMTNLRNWSMAMKQYTLENKGQTPHTTTAPLDYWYADLAPYVGEPSFVTRNPTGWIKANLCPKVETTPDTKWFIPGGGVAGTPLPNNSSYWGSSSTVWQWGDPNVFGGTGGSYCINLWLMPNEGQKQDPANYWGRYVNVPGDAPLLGDGIWIGGWPKGDEPPGSADLPPSDTEHGNASQEASGWGIGGLMGRWVINRHELTNMSISMSFADGTSRTVRLGDLWKLRWHKNFIPTSAYEEEYP